MSIISQIKKAVGKAEFSKDAKKKINSILAGKKDLSAQDKEHLLDEIKNDMFGDLAEVQACRIVLKEINKLLPSV